MPNIFEFTSSFQFEDKDIKEYIEVNDIKSSSDFNIDSILEFVCEKYNIGGWGQELIGEDHDRVKDLFDEILTEKGA